MYQAWQWGGTAATTAATTNDPTYLQSAATQVAATQWPAGYNQYAVTPEMQQQWAAAWASQAQLAYGGTVAAVGLPTTAYTGAWPEGYQAAAGYVASATNEQHSTSSEKNSNKTEKLKADKPTEELVPKDPAEQEKLNQLKAQAEQWKSLRQPTTTPSWPYAPAGATAISYVQQPGSTKDQNPALASQANTNVPKASPSETKEEEEFERQFNEWEKQFETWKQQNINHPDKEAFARYEKQWQEWRSQLIQKKELMQKAKAERLAGKAQNLSQNPNGTGMQQPPASVPDPKTFYQNTPYMYMQPYVYPTPGGPMMPVSGQFPSQTPEMAGYPEPPQGGMVPDASKLPLLPLPGMDSNMNPEKKPFDGKKEDRFYKDNDPIDQNFEDSQHPDSFMQRTENEQEGDWQFNNRGGGRGRGANRAHGRGGRRGRGGRGRWMTSPEAHEMEPLPIDMRNEGLGFNPNIPHDEFNDRPPFDDYPPDEFDPNFMPEEGGCFPGNRPGGPPRENFPPNGRFPGGRPGQDGFPPEGRFPGNRPGGGQDCFPGDRPGKHPREGFGPDERFPGNRPPGGPQDDFPPEDCFPGDRPPLEGGFPPEDHFPGNRAGGPHDENFPPDDRFPGGRPAGRLQDDFPPEEPFDFPKGPHRDGFPGGPPRDEFPPEDFDDRFQGPPHHQGRFPRDQKRFPPRDGERFMGGGGEFEDFPPPMHDNRFGPPPFPDELLQGPPFDDDMMPRGGRGRFGGPGRDFPPGPNRDFPMGPERDFPPEQFDDRFPPGPPERMRRGGMRRGGPPFRPSRDFPPEDEGFRFGGGFPQERMNPRMPPGKNMRPGPPFDDPGFGPPRPGPGFPDDPYFEDGPPPPMQFKTIDYTHRPASAVIGDNFQGNYEYENQFDSDVVNFRVYDYAHRREKSPVHPDREYNQDGQQDAPFGGPERNSRFDESRWDPPFRDGPRGPPFRGGPREQQFRDGPREPPFRDGPRELFRDGLLREPPFRDGPREPLLRDGQREPSFRDEPREPSFREDRKDSSFRDRESDRSRDRERNRDRDYDKDRSRDREGKENRDKERERDKDKDKDRDSKRDRDWERERKDKDDGPREKRYRWDKPDDKNSEKESSEKKENGERNSTESLDYKKHSDTFKSDSSTEATLIKDLLMPPARFNRPKQLVIILRGLPGSGKTYVAKLIKDKEIENGGSAPRILSLDDYFMVEIEKTDVDPDTGKKIKKKEFEYEYELEMEEAYRTSLFKSFKKTIDDRFFPFIIIDAVHEKSKQYEQYWSYAKQRGFQVYIAEMDCVDPLICHKKNVHKRSLEDINKLLKNWEKKPRHFLSLDVRSLLQDVAITEVEMEVETATDKKADDKEMQEDDIDEENAFMSHVPSRWEKLEATEEKLDQLDGLRISKKKHSSMEDYLQLPDDYEERKCEPGKKRVRWADLEERKEQDRLRAIGFVVGQTDWSKLTDPSHADRALTKTKYF